MKIYLIRHGQTEFNKIDRIQGGRIDSPLLLNGIEKAKEVGKRLEDIHFDRVYASPLGRTMDTAKYVLSENKYKNQTHIIEEKDLREMDFGLWEGKLVEEIKNEPEFVHLRQVPEKYNPSQFQGESYEELVKRSSESLRKIVENQNDVKNILIVSHGITITTLIKYVTGQPVSEFRKDGIVDNTSVSILETNDNGDNYEIIRYNG